jgi:NitT/TauT family transport system permease protein
MWRLVERYFVIVLIVVGWEVLAATGVIDPFFISQPSLIVERIAEWVQSGDLWIHIAVTAEEAILGFLIGLGLGVVCGIFCGLNGTLAKATVPLISVGNALPKLAFAPLLVAWFGFGIASKVALAASVVFFFVFFGVYSGIQAGDRVVVANARIMGGKGWLLMRHVYLPSALTWIVASLRLSIAYAFAAAVIGEYLGSSHGLGYLIIYGKSMLDMTDIFAALVIIVAIVGCIDAGLRKVGASSARWQDRDVAGQAVP